jgi:hypothetical protein
MQLSFHLREVNREKPVNRKVADFMAMTIQGLMGWFIIG